MENFKNTEFIDLQGKKLKAGDIINCKIPINENTVEILLDNHLIKINNNKASTLANCVIKNIGTKLTIFKLYHIGSMITMQIVGWLNFNAYTTILFQEIAEAMYHKIYPNNDLEYVYTIDRRNQAIAKIHNRLGLNERCALFATEEDAKLAVEVYKILDKYYNGEQED